jgi:hypothetical protein
MKRGIVGAMPTQYTVDPNETPWTVRYSYIFGISRTPFIRPLLIEVTIDLDKLEEISISKATGVRKELLIIARNQIIRQLQKNINDLINGDQTQSELQKFRKIQDVLMKLKAMDPLWKVKLKF